MKIKTAWMGSESTPPAYRPVNEAVAVEILQTLEYPFQYGCYDDLVQYTTFDSLLCDMLYDVQQRAYMYVYVHVHVGYDV